MNKFNVKCPGCGGVYLDALIEGFSKLLHPGYRYGDPDPKLPTPNCIGSFDYISFIQCGHCCPETFGLCPECIPPHTGQPTKNPCRC